MDKHLYVWSLILKILYVMIHLIRLTLADPSLFLLNEAIHFFCWSPVSAKGTKGWYWFYLSNIAFYVCNQILCTVFNEKIHNVSVIFLYKYFFTYFLICNTWNFSVFFAVFLFHLSESLNKFPHLFTLQTLVLFLFYNYSQIMTPIKQKKKRWSHISRSNYHYTIYRECIRSPISVVNQEFLYYFSRNNTRNVLENGFLTCIFNTAWWWSFPHFKIFSFSMEIISKVKPYWKFNFFKKFISVLSLKTYTVDAWWEKSAGKNV